MTKFGIDLPAYKVKMIAQLDASAEAVRLRFVTPGAGQALAYMTKLEEAKAYVAVFDPQGDEPDPNGYPHLAAEAPVDNMTLYQKAQQILNIAAMWSVISSKIDAMRLARKQAIDVATTPSEIKGLAVVDWEAVLS